MADEEKDAILCELFACLAIFGDLRKQYDQLVSEVSLFIAELYFYTS